MNDKVFFCCPECGRVVARLECEDCATMILVDTGSAASLEYVQDPMTRCAVCGGLSTSKSIAEKDEDRLEEVKCDGCSAVFEIKITPPRQVPKSD